MDSYHYRVLVIEDSPTILHVTMHRLDGEGFQCEGAETAEKGLELLDKKRLQGQPFDAVLLDWNLPGLSGADMAKALRENPDCQDLAIMIYSENPDVQAYQMAGSHPNYDLQLKSDLEKLPARLNKFIAICKAGVETAMPDATSPGNDNRESWRILFVDDSPTIRAKYYELLSANNYEVEVAENMTAALATAKTFHPEIAIIDYMMPGGNGDEVVRELLKSPDTSDVTSVLFSQRNDVLVEALDAGAIDLIWKDEPTHVFLMRIKALGNIIHAQREATQLEVFKAAADMVGLGVIMETNDKHESYNEKMNEYVQECGTLDMFLEDRSAQLSLTDSEGYERHFERFNLDLKGRGNMVLVQDVTIRKLQEKEIIDAREEAVDANRTKSQFLASMSHEIRTPMAGVMGMADMLLDDDLPQASQDKIYEIKDATSSLLQIINDILDISKMEAGKLEIECLDFHAPSLISDVTGLFEEKRKAGRKKPLALNIELDENFPVAVNADPTRLRQILINLIGNAVKFTESGSVTLKGACREINAKRYLHFSIQDTGIGMEPETLKKLFTEFSQADASITRTYEGTGLGLAICKRLVDNMGGEIDVESQQGEGSTFWFTLPYVEAKTDVAALRSNIKLAVTRYRATRPIHILVAEDNALNQQIIGAYLTGMGHSYVFADDGSKALKAHATQSFDLILMDIRMPEMSGVDATRRIRQMKGDTSAIPIIALTADVMEEHKAEYFDSGINDLVSKPINVSELALSINKVLGEDLNVPFAEEAPSTARGKKDKKPAGESDQDVEDLLKHFQDVADKLS